MAILKRNSGFNHEYHYMIGKVGNFIDSFLFVLRLCGNDDLCAFLPDLFQDFIKSLFKKIGCV